MWWLYGTKFRVSTELSFSFFETSAPLVHHQQVNPIILKQSRVPHWDLRNERNLTTKTACNLSLSLSSSVITHHGLVTLPSCRAAWALYSAIIPRKRRLSITKLISQKLDGFTKAWICSSVTEAYCPLWWCKGGYQMPSWLPHSRWKKIGCGL